jgi:hypothetical protein
VDDASILQRVKELVDEEHHLEAGGGAPDPTRLDAINVELDQCWDLLRQRRARRDAGQDPDGAHVRGTGTVEGYQQ